MTLSQVLKPWGILCDTDITEEHAGSIFRIIEIKECHTKPNNWVVLRNCNLYGGVYSNAQLFFCFKMLALYITEMFIKVIHFKFTKHLKESTQIYYHLILLFLSLYGLVYHSSGIQHHNYMKKKVLSVLQITISFTCKTKQIYHQNDRCMRFNLSLTS